MNVKRVIDGGGFPMFTSYHDYRLPVSLVGPLSTDDVQFRRAFEDLVRALQGGSRLATPFQCPSGAGNRSLNCA